MSHTYCYRHVTVIWLYHQKVELETIVHNKSRLGQARLMTDQSRPGFIVPEW